MVKKAVVIGVVFLVLLAVFTGCNGEESLDDIDAEIAASALVSLADSHIESCVSSIEAVAITQEAQSGDWEEMVDLLTRIQETQVPTAIWFALPDGSYYTVDLGLTSSNISDREYFPGLMEGNNVLGDLVVSKSTGKKSLIAAVPVVKDGEVIGGIGASIFLDSLSEILVEEMSLPEDMVFYAVNDGGEVALHSDTELILEEDPCLSENVVSVTSQLTGWDFALGYE